MDFNGSLTGNSSAKPPCENWTLNYGISEVMDEYPNYVAGIILFLSTIANFLVLRGVILTKPRPSSYYFIGNIALAELIDNLWVPFKLHHITRPWYWIFGKVMCTLVYVASIACSLVVSSTLAAFSIYACYILLHSSRRKSNISAVYIVLGIIWLAGIAISTPFGLFTNYVRDNLCDTKINVFICAHNSDSSNYQFYLNISLIICRLSVPFFVVILSYGFLLCLVKKLLISSRRRHDETQSESMEMNDVTFRTRKSASSLTTSSDSSGNGNRKDSRQLHKMEATLLRMTFWMVVVFVVCYSPDNFIYFAWRSKWLLNTNINTLTLRKHSVLLMLLAKLVHPICFGWGSGIIARNFVSCF